ncbi:hypothetical protein J4E91_008790 [Alternaria rosae]|nr:hypothetical protein J4E91_008790 [Alternaria rosae]
MDRLWNLISSSASKEFGASLVGIWILYWLAVGVYRVYLHPLASIPGPKLAAFTFWYEFYYEIYPHRFQYMWKIKRLHEEYGAILETMDHDLHKLRRNAVSPFFSKRSVQALEGLVVNNTKKLVNRFAGEMDKTGPKAGVINLNNAYAAFTMDIISEYCFGESMKSLDHDEYAKDWLKMMHEGMQIEPFARQFPTIFNFMLDLPPHIVAKLDSGIAQLNAFNLSMLGRIKRIMNREDGDGDAKNLRRTIFHDIRDDVGCKLPEKEKEPMRLMADASVILGAGTETTARTMAVTTYYLIKDPEIGEKLREELKTVMPTVNHEVSLSQLEALPYLTAVINEGLRCAHGVSSRQPRIPTGESLQYGPFTIPRGTPVMQSSYLLHTDPSIYPDPLTFRPERWLENPKLTRYFFAFGRGSRNCLGMNLATSELYTGLAMIWRRFRMEMNDTVEKRDVLTTNDCFLGMPDLGSEGIQVRVVGVVEG